MANFPMNPKHKILLVDDDKLIQTLISRYLEHAGYDVAVAGTGQEMFDCLNKNIGIDLVILDLGLPDEDGLVLARKLRARSDLPIMILTARDGVDDRLAGLDVGADDYLTKTVDPAELLLRVRNLLRRSATKVPAGAMGSKNEGNIIQFDGWIVDSNGYTLTSPDGQDVTITPGEFRVLYALLKSRGRVLSRDQLLDAITGHEEAPNDRMIDAFISRIRKKIEKNPRRPAYIMTVTGVGYRFSKEKHASDGTGTRQRRKRSAHDRRQSAGRDRRT